MDAVTELNKTVPDLRDRIDRIEASIGEVGRRLLRRPHFVRAVGE